MPVIFKSKATGNLLMVNAHAEALLATLGKTAREPGILQVHEMPRALLVLHGLPDDAEPPGTPPPRDDDDREARDQLEAWVSPRKRAWPLVRMIETAQAAGEPIVWGV